MHVATRRIAAKTFRMTAFCFAVCNSCGSGVDFICSEVGWIIDVGIGSAIERICFQANARSKAAACDELVEKKNTTPELFSSLHQGHSGELLTNLCAPSCVQLRNEFFIS